MMHNGPSLPNSGIAHQAAVVAMQRLREDFQLALVVMFGIED